MTQVLEMPERCACGKLLHHRGRCRGFKPQPKVGVLVDLAVLEKQFLADALTWFGPMHDMEEQELSKLHDRLSKFAWMIGYLRKGESEG